MLLQYFPPAIAFSFSSPGTAARIGKLERVWFTIGMRVPRRPGTRSPTMGTGLRREVTRPRAERREDRLRAERRGMVGKG